MKKSTRIGLGIGIAGLALSVPATAWLLGREIEAAHVEQFRRFAEQPLLKIVRHDFERGVFSSRETITFEFGGPLLAEAPRKASTAMPDGLRFTLHNDIRHGPLPALSTFAAARVDSVFRFEGELQELAARLFGEQAPLQARTVYGFSGSGVATLSSPAARTTAQSGQDTPATARVDWGGMQFQVNFERGMARYTLTGGAPRLEIQTADGVGVALADLRLSADQARLIASEPLFYTGSQKFTIGRLQMQHAAEPDAAILFEQLGYDLTTPVSGDYLDIVARMAAQTLRIGAQEYGPAHYDFSLKHLHAPTLASLHRAANALYADPAAFAASQDNPAAILAPLAEPLTELLAHTPEVSIDRLAFRTPAGEASLAARARLDQARREELSDPQRLLGKLDASAEFSLPEALLAGLGHGQEDQDGNSAPTPRFEQQLAAASDRGYITRENGQVRSRVVFTRGQLTVNGRPFHPGR